MTWARLNTKQASITELSSSARLLNEPNLNEPSLELCSPRWIAATVWLSSRNLKHEANFFASGLYRHHRTTTTRSDGRRKNPIIDDHRTKPIIEPPQSNHHDTTHGKNCSLPSPIIESEVQCRCSIVVVVLVRQIFREVSVIIRNLLGGMYFFYYKGEISAIYTKINLVIGFSRILFVIILTLWFEGNTNINRWACLQILNHQRPEPNPINYKKQYWHLLRKKEKKKTREFKGWI